MNVFLQREQLLEALRGGAGLGLLLWRLSVGSLVWAVLYGAVLGVQIGGWQAVSSPIKLPFILLGTGVLCIGALYVMLALAGARLRWGQVIGLALCAVSASALTMAALLPVTAFWTFVFLHGDNGPITLTHCAAFAIAGTVGVSFGLEMGARLLPARRLQRTLIAWMCVYGLVAQQMAWLFRPYFYPTSTFIHPLDEGGTALQRVLQLLWDLVRHG